MLSYLLIRRLEHPVLPWLWLYGIVKSAIMVGSGPILARSDTATEFGWGITAVSAILAIVLVWFARKVSAESFRHSLLFICLAAPVHVQGSFIPPQFLAGPSFASPLSTHLIILIASVVLKGIAVWALVNTQCVVSSARPVLPSMMAVLLLGLIFIPLAPVLRGHLHLVSWKLGVLSVGASGLMLKALIIAVAYAVRIREPRSPATATSRSA